jgi:membrane protein YqaA with SNARE-associated domain
MPTAISFPRRFTAPTKRLTELTDMRLSMGKIISVTVMIIAIILIVASTLGREIMSGRQPGLWSFTLVHFAGYLFFLLMPVELLVPLYLAEGHPAVILVGLSIGTAVAAQIFDYFIGRLLSEKVINMIGRKKYDRFKGKIDRYGGWAIFTFNLFPLSSPNMLLVSGMVRFNAVHALAISAGGLTVKYVAIVILFG